MIAYIITLFFLDLLLYLLIKNIFPTISTTLSVVGIFIFSFLALWATYHYINAAIYPLKEGQTYIKQRGGQEFKEIKNFMVYFNKIKKGQTKNEVVSLLGKPSAIQPLAILYYIKEKERRYAYKISIIDDHVSAKEIIYLE